MQDRGLPVTAKSRDGREAVLFWLLGCKGLGVYRCGFFLVCVFLGGSFLFVDVHLVFRRGIISRRRVFCRLVLGFSTFGSLVGLAIRSDVTVTNGFSRLAVVDLVSPLLTYISVSREERHVC